MQTDSLIQTVRTFAEREGSGHGYRATPIDGLGVMISSKPTSIEAVLYEPLVCLILQGQKETAAGTQSVTFGAGETLIVSHELPVLSRVTKASAKSPYIALILRLDLRVVRSLFDELSDTELHCENSRALDVGSADARLVDAMGRLFELIDRPVEAKVMQPLLLREIHFRLLLARHGAMLRQLLSRGSHADRIAKVINRIKAKLSASHAVPELARIAGMSASSFHEHFKRVTGMTPRQYQKDLRLLESRRLLLEGAISVAGVAYEVGYESPTQFSREYSRKFDVPPSADLRSGP